MDRRQATRWAGILAIITGVLALGTATISLLSELQASRENGVRQEKKVEDLELALKKQNEAYQEQKRIDAEAQRQAMAEQARANLCLEHSDRRIEIESRFSALMRAHGMLMNSLRSCAHERNSEDQNDCAAFVCATAYFGTSGESNCVASVGEGLAIKADMERENRLAAGDGCSVPASAVIDFFS